MPKQPRKEECCTEKDCRCVIVYSRESCRCEQYCKCHIVPPAKETLLKNKEAAIKSAIKGSNQDQREMVEAAKEESDWQPGKCEVIIKDDELDWERIKDEYSQSGLFDLAPDFKKELDEDIKNLLLKARQQERERIYNIFENKFRTYGMYLTKKLDKEFYEEIFNKKTNE